MQHNAIKPTPASRNQMHGVAVTPRQMARIAAGKKESDPSEYQTGSPAQRRQGEVRRALEDRQMLKELGLL